MSLKREIIVTTQHIGFHSWPEAPDVVSFLRNKHRHLFKIKVGIPVYHNDRQREFFIEQADLNAALDAYNMQDVGSCEMLAAHLLNTIPHASWCEVWEDGENGARLTR